MSGYHNIVMPDEFSQGSAFSIGYDTRITVLESGVETRMARYRPDGRRRYNVLRGIAKKSLILQLYEFYILREGALNSFKFKDWFDHATNTTRTLFQPTDPPVTENDSDLTLITGRAFQMTTTYQDVANSVVRPLTKIVPGTALISVNGSATTLFTINNETGVVTIAESLGIITQISGGCEFRTVVRFADNTDEAFTVAMQATDGTQSLPGFDLIEDISASTVSQDYQYGGTVSYVAPTTDIRITEISGRLQLFSGVTQAGVLGILPPTLDIPRGGPIFIVHNSVTSTQSVQIVSAVFANVVTLLIGETALIFLAEGFTLTNWFAMK